MIIEIKKNTGNAKDPQTYTVFVDNEVKYDNLTYEELTKVTIGELDRVEEG